MGNASARVCVPVHVCVLATEAGQGHFQLRQRRSTLVSKSPAQAYQGLGRISNKW